MTLTKSHSELSINSRPFQYDVLPDRHLRLFKLDIDDANGALSGQLLTTFWQWDDFDILRPSFYKNINENYSVAQDADQIMKELSGSKKFHKISYCWGDQTETTPLRLSVIHSRLGPDEKVQLNSEPYRNGVIQIGANLRDLLLEVRRRKYEYFLWIDAICINQKNAEEVRSQVALMRPIYASDGNVILWLGSTNLETSMAAAMLANLTKRLTGLAEAKAVLDPSQSETFTNANLPEPSSPVWQSVAQLFKHDYFSRLWTLQEVVVAQNALSSDWHTTLLPDLPIWLGTATLTLQLFGNFDAATKILGLRPWLITGRTHTIPRSLLAFDGLKEIRMCRDSLQANAWGITPHALLLGTRRRKSTVPVDAVFGMFALMDNETRIGMTPKGPFLTENVFIDFGKYYVLNEHRENLLNHTQTKERNPKLPSWCPNFASPPSTLSIGSRGYVDDSLKSGWQDQHFHAGFQKKGKWALPVAKFTTLRGIGHFMTGKTLRRGFKDAGNPRQIALIEGSNTLLAKGLHIDFVADSVPPSHASESDDFLSPDCSRETSQWIERCLSMARRCLPDDDRFLDTFVRTIVTNRVVAEVSYTIQTDTDQRLLDYNGEVDLVARYMKWKVYAESLTDPQNTALTPAVLDAETLQFAEVLCRITTRRRFFITEDGRVGLGPTDLQDGDSVCIFFFCPTPYIIRSNENGRHRLIGESYVHGIMYGEALNMFDSNTLRETKWAIE